jgi:hypothetical protein
MKALTVIFAFLLATGSCVARPIGHIEQVSLERTTCYGWCPAYTVTVFGDGRVEYEGKRFVKIKGKRTKRIDINAIRKLTSEVERINYFDLRDSYASPADGCPTTWTDNPAAITSVRAGGKTKRIHHYLGCRENVGSGSIGESYPRGLAVFEDRIDAIVGTAEWIGTEPERARNRD